MTTKHILILVPLFLIIGLGFKFKEQSNIKQTFSYTFFVKQKKGTLEHIEKNKADLIIIYNDNTIKITYLEFISKFKNSYIDNHLIYYEFENGDKFIITDDYKRARYDGGDYEVEFFPLIKK